MISLFHLKMKYNNDSGRKSLLNTIFMDIVLYAKKH